MRRACVTRRLTEQAWLNAEGQHAILQSTLATDKLNVAAALKLASGLHVCCCFCDRSTAALLHPLKRSRPPQDTVNDDTQRVSDLQANVTSELQEIAAEEAMINQVLGLVQQITTTPPPATVGPCLRFLRSRSRGRPQTRARNSRRRSRPRTAGCTHHRSPPATPTSSSPSPAPSPESGVWSGWRRCGPGAGWRARRCLRHPFL